MSNAPMLSYQTPKKTWTHLTSAYGWIFLAYVLPLAALTWTFLLLSPKFKEIFRDFRVTLPLLTSWVLRLDTYIDEYWFVTLPGLFLFAMVMPILPAFYVARAENSASRRRRLRAMIWLALLFNGILALGGMVALVLPLIRLLRAV